MRDYPATGQLLVYCPTDDFMEYVRREYAGYSFCQPGLLSTRSLLIVPAFRAGNYSKPMGLAAWLDGNRYNTD